MQSHYYIRYCALGEGFKYIYIYIFGLNTFKYTCNVVSVCVPENHTNEEAGPGSTQG